MPNMCLFRNSNDSGNTARCINWDLLKNNYPIIFKCVSILYDTTKGLKYF